MHTECISLILYIIEKQILLLCFVAKFVIVGSGTGCQCEIGGYMFAVHLNGSIAVANYKLFSFSVACNSKTHHMTSANIATAFNLSNHIAKSIK